MTAGLPRLPPAVANRLRFVVLATLGVNLLLAPYRALRDAADTDYVAYITGARALAKGLCLYCDNVQIAVQSQFLGFSVARIYHDHYVHPPPDALLFLPLAWLPLRTGLAIWLAFDAAFLIMAGFLLWTFTDTLDRIRRISVMILGLASIPAAFIITLGQVDALALLAAAAGIWLLRRDRAFLAGLVMAVALIKPQVIWLVPLILLVKRMWPALLGFAIGALAFACLSLLLAGPGITHWPAELALNLQYGNGLGRLARELIGTWAVWPLSIAVALAGAYLYWRWSKDERDPVCIIGAGVALSLLASPFIMGYEMGVAAVCLIGATRKNPSLLWPLGIAISLAALLENWLIGAQPLSLLLLAVLFAGNSTRLRPAAALRLQPAP